MPRPRRASAFRVQRNGPEGREGPFPAVSVNFCVCCPTISPFFGLNWLHNWLDDLFRLCVLLDPIFNHRCPLDAIITNTKIPLFSPEKALFSHQHDGGY